MGLTNTRKNASIPPAQIAESNEAKEISFLMKKDKEIAFLKAAAFFAKEID